MHQEDQEEGSQEEASRPRHGRASLSYSRLVMDALSVSAEESPWLEPGFLIRLVNSIIVAMALCQSQRRCKHQCQRHLSSKLEIPFHMSIKQIGLRKLLEYSMLISVP